MYIIEDESLAKMLDGEFYQIIMARKINPKMSMNQLFNYQYKYTTYPGFRKFFKRHLEPVLNGIRIIDNNSIVGKFIKWITNEKKQ